MRYETVRHLSDEAFKRSTGVQRSTFTKLLEAVEQKLRQFGRPPKLSRADQLLLTLMYWREYRSEFHISLAYGVSESTACRTIQKIENALAQAEQFRLPGRKGIQSAELNLEVVLVDTTEQPIERPQKDNGGITVAKRGGIRKNLR